MANLTGLYIRWRYLVLLGTLLLVLVVQPLSLGFTTPASLFDLFLMFVTAALLLSFSSEKRRRLVAVTLGIPTCLLSVSSYLLVDQAHNVVLLVGHGFAVLFYFWAAALIVAGLLRRQTLSIDSVFGAICGYLLLGMAWGVLYSMLDAGRAGSFQVGERLAEQVQMDRSRLPLFTYYSFITLTTVGYGDVTPVSPATRTCAWLEALTGQFYLAVLVAGLIGALLARRSEDKDTA